MSKGFSALAVHRPVLTTVIYIIIIVIGLFSLWRLPIDLMPEISNPTITVITNYGNAGPQEIEELITRKIESALAGIQGIEELTSTSREGRSTVRALFVWGTNLDEAVNDIRDKIDRVYGNFPDGVDRPTIRKFDMSSFPILMLGVSSDLEDTEVRQLIDDQIQYRLERCDGVASVDLRGGASREIKVALRVSALDALKITPDMVVSTLKQENRNIPAGSVYLGNKEIIVRTFAEYGSLDDVRNAIIAVRDGVPVTVGEVADISDGVEEITSLVRINGKPGFQLSVSKQSGINTVAVAKGVLSEIKNINRDIPSIKIITLTNTATFIERSINGVGSALLIGGFFAVLVLLIFLRNVSSTLIIGTTIPVSIIATFALMYFGGLTLNMMTFGGLALGIGMLVDNAIVVLDNIFHEREKGGKPVDSAIKGASSVTSAVIASTLTTLVVFFPVIFIRGISGIMFRQLAYVVSFSIACSLFASLTLVPMLSSRFLRINTVKKEKKTIFSIFFEKSENIYQYIELKYGKVIAWALNHRRIILVGSLLLFIGSILIVPLVGVELTPSADESEVRINVEMEIGSKLEFSDSAVFKIESIIQKNVPEAEYIMSNIGGSGWNTSGGHTASIRVALVPKSKRKRSSADVANALRSSIGSIPGATIRVREGQGLFLLRMGNTQAQEVAIELRGRDLETGQRLAKETSDIVKDIPGVTDVKVSREAGTPEYVLHINRKKAAEIGLTASQIGSVIQTVMGGTQASTIRRDGKEFPILVRLSENERKQIDQLANIPMINSKGISVPLQAVVNIEESLGPTQIDRRDRERIVTVSVNYAGRNLGEVVEDVREKLKNSTIPSDFSIIIRGDYEEQQKSSRELMIGVLMAIMLVYLVMAGQFESFKDPLIVLFSIPMALIGVVSILYLSGTPFSVQAYIGCIILAGIVVNNAIVLIDYMNRLHRDEGVELREAIISAGVRRLRPIMMTASTTSLGLLPLALALGEGGETQAPMARVVIGGLLTSTLITLLLIPVVYSIVEERHIKKKKLGKSEKLAITAILGFLVFIFTQGEPSAATDDTLRISLEDMLNRAVKDNPLLNIERIDINIAEATVRENRYKFEPLLNAAIEQQTAINDTVSSSPGYAGSVALLQQFPTGTSLEMKGTAMEMSRNNVPSLPYQRTFSLTVTQALLADGGLGPNLADIRKSSIDVDLRKEELAGYAQKLLSETEKAYWSVYLAEKEVAIHKKSLHLVERLFYESNERLKVGRLAPLDLVAVKAEAALRQKNMIAAEAAFIQKKYQLAYYTHDSLSKWNRPVLLIDQTPKPEYPDSITLHIKAAYKYRPDLRQIVLTKDRGGITLVQTRNGLLPKLDLFIALSGTAYAESFGNVFSGVPDNQNEIAAGLSFSFPVTNGAAREKYNKEQLNQKQLTLSIDNMTRLVELDVRIAWVELEKTFNQLEAAKVTRELQEEKLAAEQVKLGAGKSTEYFVLQAQRDLIAAQLEEVRADVAYVNARTDLFVKDGTLLERRGVKSLPN